MCVCQVGGATLLVLAGVAACAAGRPAFGAGAASGADAAALKSEVAAVAAGLKELDTMWYAALDRTAAVQGKDRKSCLLRLTFERAYFRNTLHVEIVNTPGMSRMSSRWWPTDNKRFAVECPDLEVIPRVKGTVRFAWRPDETDGLGGGGNDATVSLSIIFYKGGTVVRADDGKVLIENLAVSSWCSTPNVVDDRVFHFGGVRNTCHRLFMFDRDTVGAELVWSHGNGSGFQLSHAAVSGQVYREGIFHLQAGDQGCQGYLMFDSATGRPVRHQARDYKFCGGRAYMHTAISSSGS